MQRHVAPEILDRIDPSDPRARRSRRDLRRVNLLMGHRRLIGRALSGGIDGTRLVELGSGDGTLLLEVARGLAPPRAPVRALLIDRAPLISGDTRAAFASRGWQAEAAAVDVLEWLRDSPRETADVMIANLFLHHFSDAQLRDLLREAALRTTRFLAFEPRRSPAATLGAAALGFVGCNDVTRHDARVSVRAGFRDRELSALWPMREGWRIAEGRAGPFTHMFEASRAA